MRIAAVGDIHGKDSFEPFLASLAAISDPDLFLLAGDLTDRNDFEDFGAVVAAVKERVSCPIVAIFGNNEFTVDHPKYREAFDLIFLDDEDRTFTLGGTAVRIIGSVGCLDEPTWWMRKHLPDIEREFDSRIRRLDALLAGDDFRILFIHYPPTHVTMGGEKEEWRTQLGSLKMEEVVLRRRPNLVIHGHVHRGIPFAELRSRRPTLDAFAREDRAIPVYNVGFPVTRRVTEIVL